MDSSIGAKSLRRLAIVAVVFFFASLVVTGVNAYVTLAAPMQAPFVPSTVGFQGQLANTAGQPVSNGSYTISFKLYDAETGGTVIWSETQSVQVANGLYSVQLGSVTALNAAHFDGSRWLGVQVGGDSEMTPRIPISAVPFALNAQQAMGLQGYNVASTAPTNGQVLTWDGTTSTWKPSSSGARTFPELSPVANNEDPQDFFSGYRNGATVEHDSTTSVRVTVGELFVNGRMRRNTSSITIPMTGTPSGSNRGLDTGATQPNTPYYVYAVADDDETTFDVIFSTNSSTPTGPSNYQLLGWFVTNSSSSPIQVHQASVGNLPSPNQSTYLVARQIDSVNSSGTYTAVDTILPANALSGGTLEFSFRQNIYNAGPYAIQCGKVKIELGGSLVYTSGDFICADTYQWANAAIQILVTGMPNTNSQRITVLAGPIVGTPTTISVDRTVPQRLRILVANGGYSATLYPFTVIGTR